MSEAEPFLDGRVVMHCGDCLAVLDTLPENSIDSVVCDPPYHLTSIVKRFGKPGSAAAKDYTGERENATGAYARASAGFMGKAWDGGDIAFRPETWAKVLRVLKPGGHLFAFSGTRTYHRMVCAIEDAWFEIRDQFAWAYASGFPKSHDISKAIDRAAGAEREVVGVAGRSGSKRSCMAGDFAGGEYFATAAATDAAREWAGWGTAAKPAWEPIVLARKPLSERTVAANVLRWGTGALNIDGCRVEAPGETITNHGETGKSVPTSYNLGARVSMQTAGQVLGRWPANLVHDGSDEVTAAFPQTKSGTLTPDMDVKPSSGWSGGSRANRVKSTFTANEGSAARFFFSAKADADDRLGSKHPTVKPVDLMQWLCRLITPPGGTVLDCFAGTGTTGEAAFREGFRAVLIEREPEYQADIRRRMGHVLAGPEERKRTIVKARGKVDNAGPLFGDAP